jgi:hypothetical protein
MKSVITALILVLAACSGGEGEPDLFASDAGTHTVAIVQGIEADAPLPEDDVEKIYRNGDFGVQTSGERCNISATSCAASYSKTRRYKFFASTCSSAFQGYFVNAMTGLESFMSAYGWTLVGDGQTYDVELRCGTTVDGQSLAGSTGGTVPKGAPTVATVDGGRNWAMYPKHLVTINSSLITGLPEWATASATSRERFVTNVIRHEWGHVFGLGHNPTSNELMNAYVQPNYWTGLRGYTVATERYWLDCYNPSVPSTTPLCD